MSVIGIDPGISGASVMYGDGGSLTVEDMPTFEMAIGKSLRKRIDAVALFDQFSMFKMMGARLAIIEAVGGRPRQGASAAFVLGYSAGLVYMTCVALRIPIETVTPGVWKKAMSVPGKKDANGDDKAAKAAIMQRAQEMFPDSTHLFRGTQGGAKPDRAEAAMLAKYGRDFCMKADIIDGDFTAQMRAAKMGDQ